MKLYILKPKKDHPRWENWCDKCFGVVVRAETKSEARKLASSVHMDEGSKVWLRSKDVTCDELKQQGPSEVIIRNEKYG